jgi:hypothetical protein
LCKRFGPFNSHNCFAFEKFYGWIIDHKSGTHHMQEQMAIMTGARAATNVLAYQQPVTNDNKLGKLFEKLNLPVINIVNK